MNRIVSWIASLPAMALCVGAAGADVDQAKVDETAAPRLTRVVFVCEHGSVKSLVAAVLFNHRAQQRGLPFRAVARGTAPGPAVPDPVRDGLRHDGIDASEFRPQLLKAADLDDAALVVSFDQDLEKTVSKRMRQLRWDGLPEVLSDYSRGRDAIARHVDALLDELAHSAPP